MSNAAPFVRIPVHDGDLTWIIEDLRPLGHRAPVPVRERLNGRHQHRTSGMHNLSHVDCPACGERVKKSNNIPYATCRLPEGCGHMFCCQCLVDYLPVMREGNHQHRATCRHYQPLGLVDAPPAYVIQPVNQFSYDQGRTQATYHPVEQELGPLFMRNEGTPKWGFRAMEWLKRVVFMTLVCYASLVLLGVFFYATGYCECESRGGGARLTLPAPAGGFLD